MHEGWATPIKCYFLIGQWSVNQNENKEERGHNKGSMVNTDSFYYRTKSRKVMRIMAKVNFKKTFKRCDKWNPLGLLASIIGAEW